MTACFVRAAKASLPTQLRSTLGDPGWNHKAKETQKNSNLPGRLVHLRESQEFTLQIHRVEASVTPMTSRADRCGDAGGRVMQGPREAKAPWPGWLMYSSRPAVWNMWQSQKTF